MESVDVCNNTSTDEDLDTSGSSHEVTSECSSDGAGDRVRTILNSLKAASERVFSLLQNTFALKQSSALQDYLEISLMLQYNR